MDAKERAETFVDIYLQERDPKTSGASASLAAVIEAHAAEAVKEAEAQLSEFESAPLGQQYAISFRKQRFLKTRAEAAEAKVLKLERALVQKFIRADVKEHLKTVFVEIPRDKMFEYTTHVVDKTAEERAAGALLALKNLVEQLGRSNAVDDHGHMIENLVAYVEAKDALRSAFPALDAVKREARAEGYRELAQHIRQNATKLSSDDAEKERWLYYADVTDRWAEAEKLPAEKA